MFNYMYNMTTYIFMMYSLPPLFCALPFRLCPPFPTALSQLSSAVTSHLPSALSLLSSVLYLLPPLFSANLSGHINKVLASQRHP